MTSPEPFPAPDRSIDVTLFDTLDAVAPLWRAFEAEAILTPYQRFDWLSGLHHAGADRSSPLAIALVSRNGKPVALLPLALHRRAGLTTARLLGTEQSNADWLPIDPAFAPTPANLTAIFRSVAKKAGGIDLIEFRNLPRQWQDVVNPLLAFPHTPAASNFYFTSLAGVTPPFIETRFVPKRRGDLKRSRRRMEETMGDVRLVRASNAAELERVQAEFLKQRRVRFDEMGVDNIFESDMFRRFFHDAAIASFGERRPAMVVHALMANNEITATGWGTTAGDHYSLYINSTDGGDASRFSLMSILLADLMDGLIEDGFTSFDIGLGDFAYKTRWTEPQEVYDCVVPLTPLGRLAASAVSARTRLKCAVKQNARLWGAVTTLRRALFRLRGR